MDELMDDREKAEMEAWKAGLERLDDDQRLSWVKLWVEAFCEPVESDKPVGWSTEMPWMAVCCYNHGFARGVDIGDQDQFVQAMTALGYSLWEVTDGDDVGLCFGGLRTNIDKVRRDANASYDARPWRQPR